jgi:hypothetical protein
MKSQSLLLFVWLLLATPVAVQAQFNYTINNGTVTITYPNWIDGAVVIPDTITGLPVTGIGDLAFDSDTNLTSVTIPNSVTSIGDFAFGQCSSLTNIMVDPLNSTYSSLDGVLFNHDQTILLKYPSGKLGIYSIPNTVTSIGFAAFCGKVVHVVEGWTLYDGSHLMNITIPNSVTSIGDFAFGGCSSLTNVTLGNGVASIGDNGFFRCSSLTHVKVPNIVTNIGDYAFEGCSSLTNIDLGSGVFSIGDAAFSNCTNLTSVTIPNRVSSIGKGTFYDCESLTSIIIPNSVTNIGFWAFSQCYSLTNVTIPNSVTSIEAAAFSECLGLTNVFFEGNAPAVGQDVFYRINPVMDPVTVYYLPGTTGWSISFAGFPIAIWTPEVQTADGSFGVKSNQFGFNVNWASGMSVVVEASQSLMNPVWSPVVTNTLSGGTFYFTDPNWTNYPNRFYRVRSQ